MKLAISANSENALIIRELLSVWEVNWVSPKNSDVVIVYDRNLPEICKKTILIPSNSVNFENCIKNSEYIVTKRPRESVSIEATPTINFQFASDTMHETKTNKLTDTIMEIGESGCENPKMGSRVFSNSPRNIEKATLVPTDRKITMPK